MRNITMRIELPFNTLLYGSVSRYHTLEGMNSRAENGRHFVFIDCDETPLKAVVHSLTEIQKMYDLGEIHITADDKLNSYRVWCFKQVDFRTLMRIITWFPYTDVNYIRWTARKGYATLRLSAKPGRAPQEVVHTIPGRTNKLPDEVQMVVYETPTGKSVRLGYRDVMME